MEEEKRRLQGPDQGVFCETLSSCNVIGYTYKVSPTTLDKHDLRKDDTDRHVKIDEEKSTMSQSYKKNYKQLRMLRAGKLSSLGKSTPISCSTPNSPENILRPRYTNRLYLGIYMYKHIHICMR